MSTVLGSCVGRSEGFPEVWMLGSLTGLPGAAGEGGGEGVLGRTEGVWSLGLPFSASFPPITGPSFEPRV